MGRGTASSAEEGAGVVVVHCRHDEIRGRGQRQIRDARASRRTGMISTFGFRKGWYTFGADAGSSIEEVIDVGHCT